VSQSYEIYRLRQSLAATQTKVAALSEELTSAKKGKAAVEAELEALSQELFEEANRMVSEERKLRATMEAEAAELKEERDALKRTMTLMEREVQAVSAKASGEFSQGEAINGSVSVSDGAPIVSEEGWGDIPPIKSSELSSLGALPKGPLLIRLNCLARYYPSSTTHRGRNRRADETHGGGFRKVVTGRSLYAFQPASTVNGPGSA
jgi:hypothetical protein